MVTCSVLGCKNRSRKGLTFHCFPRQEDMRQAWLDAIGRKDWEPSTHSRICAIHFDSNDFIEHNALTRLRKSSVPSLNIDFKAKKTKKQVLLPSPEADMLYISNLKSRISVLEKKVLKYQQKLRRQNKRLACLTQIIKELVKAENTENSSTSPDS